MLSLFISISQWIFVFLYLNAYLLFLTFTKSGPGIGFIGLFTISPRIFLNLTSTSWRLRAWIACKSPSLCWFSSSDSVSSWISGSSSNWNLLPRACGGSWWSLSRAMFLTVVFLPTSIKYPNAYCESISSK